MSDLPNINSWENYVYALGTSDPVLGGDGGPSNIQAQQLSNRTVYLKSLVDHTTIKTSHIVNIRESVFGVTGTGGTDDTSGIQAAIDYVALTSTEYTAATQEELKRTKIRLYFPDGVYLAGDLKIYEGMEIIFSPRAYILLKPGSVYGISVVNRPGQSNPNSGVERVILENLRIDMQGSGGVGLLLQALRNSQIIRPEIWNVPSGTFNYDDGSSAGSQEYPCTGIMLKGISGVAGAYYNNISLPRVANPTSGTRGNTGIWIGTTIGLTNQRPNFNNIVQPLTANMETGICIDIAGDNIIYMPEVSISTYGITVGRAGSGANTNRNRIVIPYLESIDTAGILLNEESVQTTIDGTASVSGTDVYLIDNGIRTAIYQGNEPAEYARFYLKEIRGVNAIKFPAVHVPNDDVNTLDDYQEGTFTAAVRGTTTAGVGEYSQNTGRYTRIGNRVFFDLYLDWTSHTGTGNMNIVLDSNAPNSNGDVSSVISAYIQRTLPLSGGPVIQAFIGGSRVVTLSMYNGTTYTSIPMDTSAGIRISGSYQAA